MSEKVILDKLAQAILDLNLAAAKEVAETAVKANIPANKIVQNGIGHGAELVSKQYEAKEYFLPELIMAGEAMKVFLDTNKTKNNKPFLELWRNMEDIQLNSRTNSNYYEKSITS